MPEEGSGSHKGTLRFDGFIAAGVTATFWSLARLVQSRHRILEPATKDLRPFFVPAASRPPPTPYPLV